jgi:hypothetical protein
MWLVYKAFTTTNIATTTNGSSADSRISSTILTILLNPAMHGPRVDHQGYNIDRSNNGKTFGHNEGYSQLTNGGLR